jgi:hypothetical protein
MKKGVLKENEKAAENAAGSGTQRKTQNIEKIFDFRKV